MAASGSPKGLPIWKLDQGEFTNIPTTAIPEMGASETNNVVMFDGRLRARPGFSLSPVTPRATDPSFMAGSIIAHLGWTLTGFFENYTIIRCQVDEFTNLNVFSYVGSGGWNHITGTPLTYYGHITSAQFGGNWLLTTGQQNLQSWDGTGVLTDVTMEQTNAALKAPAQPYFMCATGSRVFLGNAIDPNSGIRIPYRVWWSNTLDFTVWSNGGGLPAQGSAGYMDLIQGQDSSPITGMYFQGATRVIVFKRHSIYAGVYYGGPVWYEFLSITQSRGCIASGSIQCHNDVMIWLGDDYNVYTMDINSNINPIGDAVRPRIQKFFTTNFGAINNPPQITSVIDTVYSLYWLFIPYIANVDTIQIGYKIFTCNLRTGAWTEGHLADPAGAIYSAFWLNADFPFSVTRPIVILGYNDGNIYTIDYDKPTLVDKATPFGAHWWSKTYDFLAMNGTSYGPKLSGNAVGETAEFSKIAIHGESGTATPRIRMGTNIPEIQHSTYLYAFDPQTQETKLVTSYSGNERADAKRFGQMGIYWPEGCTNPMIVDGLTAWGIPRQGEAR